MPAPPVLVALGMGHTYLVVDPFFLILEPSQCPGGVFFVSWGVSGCSGSLASSVLVLAVMIILLLLVAVLTEGRRPSDVIGGPSMVAAW